jgi:uncharacterized Ntn-hydrolase superfamily protein
MAQKSNIPPNLEGKVLRLSGEGKTAQAIAEILRAEDNLSEVTHHSVYVLLARVRKTRGEQSAAITREHLAQYVLSDLKSLDDRIKPLALLIKDYEQAFAEERAKKKESAKKTKKKDPLSELARKNRGYSIAAYQKLVREFNALCRTRLHYSGAGKDLGKEQSLDGLGDLLGMALDDMESEE